MEELKAIQFIGEIKAGTTFPMKFKTIDDNIYACKFYDECSGNKHVVNEFISYHLAKKLELPIPEANLLRIEKELFPNSDYSERNGEIHSTLAFGSQWLNKAIPKVNPLCLEQCQNINQIPRILFFDQFILNNDRALNDGNLLFDYKTKLLYIIDHSHIFLKSLIWNPHTLSTDKELPLVPSFTKKNNLMLLNYLNGNNPFNNFIDELKVKFNKCFFESIVHNIPPEWDLKDEDAVAIIDFLLYRVTICDKIIDSMKDNWPYWKGV